VGDEERSRSSRLLEADPRGRWAADLQKVPEVEIKRKTAAAFEPGLKDSERLDALDLPGLRARGAVASTLLAAWKPQEFGVFDDRAVSALKNELKISNDPRELTHYFGVLRKLRDELSEIRPALGARDIDKRLYMLGRPQQLPSP
jgi:hypothetical protein